ncbi:MAG: hypothetical protein AAGH15_19395 [Myxococcota bacterium]
MRTGRPCEVWTSLRLPGQAIAHVPEALHARGEGWAAGGARWDVLEAGKRLRVSYEGPLVQGETTHDAALDLVFEGRSPVVDFTDGVAAKATAAALAREPWTRRFFEQLGEIRVVHYEQTGRLRGTVRLGADTREIDVVSMRDHSFGRRDWRSWRRHVWFSGIREDGVGFTMAHVLYDFVGPLTAGFWMDGAPMTLAEATPMDAVGAAGEIPPAFTLDLRLRDGTRHRVPVATDEVFRFDLGPGEYTIHEAIARFELGGQPAVGICEFGWSPRG